MNRRIASLAIVASLLLAAGACSKSSDTTTNTQAQTPTTAGKTESTKGETSDTKKSTDTTKATGTTRSGSTGTTRRGGTTGTTGKGGMPAARNLETTAEEEQCFQEKFVAQAAQDPELATKLEGDDAAAAELVGGLLAACLSKAKIADGIVAGLKQDNNFSDTEASCIRDEIISLDTDQLGKLLGLIVFSASQGNLQALAPVVSALNQKCGTKIPA